MSLEQNQSRPQNILWEIILLISYCLYASAISLYRLIVPIKLKSLKGEVALVTGAGNEK